MASQAIQIGPFVGGLATSSDPSSIGDTDLAELVNLELDLDGSLTNRPPVVAGSAPCPHGVNRVLGHYTDPTGQVWTVVNTPGETTYGWNGSSWVPIAAFPATDVVQFRGDLYILAPEGSLSTGGKWNGTTFSSMTGMPTGKRIVAYKDRLWICKGEGAANSSRIYMSDFNVSDAVIWNNDFFTVSGGDGEAILDLAVYYDSLVIFKSESTYRFAFATNPALGEVSLLSDSIGVTDTGCVTSHENSLYTLYQGNVYDFTNFQYLRISDKVSFIRARADVELITRYSLSVWADRLFVAFLGSTYVYGIKTKTWSEWRSDIIDSFGPLVTAPGAESAAPRAILSSASTSIYGEPSAYAKSTYSSGIHSQTYLDVLVPSEVAAGDLILVAAVTYSTSLPDTAVAAPSGSLTRAYNHGRAPWMHTYWTKIATGSETSVRLTWPTAPMDASLVCLVIKNIESDTLQFASANEHTPPAIALPSRKKALSLVSMQSRTAYAEVFAPPSGYVFLADANNAATTFRIDSASGINDSFAPGPYDMVSERIPPPANYLFVEAVHILVEIKKVAPDRIYTMNDAITTNSEEILCRFKTKYYDYGDPSRFKRLFWWGADLIASSQIDTYIEPVTFASPKSWDDLEEYSWDSPELFTWERPLDAQLFIEDVVPNPSAYGIRQFVKLLKSIRFRQAAFGMVFTTLGSTGNAPAKVFNLMTTVAQKSRVQQKVN